jgi:hypothetical protein
MESVQVLVALGGDRGNSVPKTVTPAEIPILQAIHGPDAVYDVVKTKEKIDRSNANELARLRAEYGSARDEDGKSLIAAVYPGLGATVPERLSQLNLADEHYKATSRARPDDVELTGTSMAYKESGGNTGYEPIEVPADADTGEGEQTGMVDPRSQPQVNLPPGLATATTADVKDVIVQKAEGLADARNAPVATAKTGAKTDKKSGSVLD